MLVMLVTYNIYVSAASDSLIFKRNKNNNNNKFNKIFTRKNTKHN